MKQLDSAKTILVFSHKHNTLNKEKLLENPEATKAVPTNKGSLFKEKTRKSKKPLTQKQIHCIKKCQFIPGLFKDCMECINKKSI